MNVLQVLTPELSTRVCLTLLHSLWQVTALAALAWLVGYLWRQRSVERAYAVHVTALLLSLACLPITYWYSGSAETSPAQQANVMDPMPMTIEQAEAPISLPLAANEPNNSVQEFPAVLQQPESDRQTGAFDWSALWARIVPWLAGGYLTGVIAMLCRLLLGIASAERLRTRGQSITTGPLAETLQRLSQEWSMRVVPALAQAESIVVPKVVGILKPTILLPTSALTGLSSADLEMILAHELAHVRRYDMWISLLQRVAETVLFFNPALWLLSHRIGTLREYCCDEWVCSRNSGPSSHSQIQYAQALLRVVELAKSSTASPQNIASLAASGRSPSELRRRVARLFGEPIREPLRLSRGGFAFLALLTILTLMSPFLWPARAGSNVGIESESAQEMELVDKKLSDSNKDSNTPAKVSGKIVFTDGSPANIEGMMYYDIKYSNGNGAGGTHESFTNAFTFETQPGTLWLYYYADGYAPVWTKKMEVQAGETKDDLVLVLKPGISELVRVTDEDGKPVPGATIHVHPEMHGTCQGPIFQHKTDANGEVLLEHLAPTRYQLNASAPGYQPLQTAPLRVEQGETLRPTMVRSNPTDGIIQFADGTPAPNTKLRAIREWLKDGKIRGYGNKGKGFWGTTLATTDSRGRFRLDQLTDGSGYLFVIEAADGARAIVDHLKADMTDAQVVLPQRKDLVVYVKGDLSQLDLGRKKPFVSIRQPVRFVRPDGATFEDLIGADATIEPAEGGGRVIFRGLAVDLREDAPKQTVRVSLGYDRKTQQTVDINPNGETVVRFDLQDGGENTTLNPQLIGNRFVICPVTTVLQRQLLSHSGNPPSRASVCLLANAAAFTSLDEIHGNLNDLGELRNALAKLLELSGSREVSVRLLDPMNGDFTFDQREQRMEKLDQLLTKTCKQAGYQQVRVSRNFGVQGAVGQDFQWDKYIDQALQATRDRDPSRERIADIGAVRVSSVQTFLARQLSDADCIVDVVPIVRDVNGARFVEDVLPMVKTAVENIHRTGGDKLLIRLRYSQTAQQDIEQWVQWDNPKQKEFAKQLGFQRVSVSQSALAQSEEEVAAPVEDRHEQDSKGLSTEPQKTVATDKPTKTSRQVSSDYQNILGQWEIVSIEGSGGQLMSLNGNSKPGDTLMIPHVRAPGAKYKDTKKLYNKPPFITRWYSDKTKDSWSRNDSLYLYPQANPKRLTYKPLQGDQGHFNDQDNPPQFAIYRLKSDELTLVAGNPQDYKLSEGAETTTTSSGTPVHWKWKIVIPNFPKSFEKIDEDRQLLVKLRRKKGKELPEATVSSKAQDNPATTVQKWMQLAFANKVTAAAQLVVPGQPSQADDLRRLANAKKLHISEAYATDRAAIVITSLVKAKRGRDGVIVFRLHRLKNQWLINDIDLEDPTEAKAQVEGFRGHPGVKSVEITPQPKNHGLKVTIVGPDDKPVGGVNVEIRGLSEFDRSQLNVGEFVEKRRYGTNVRTDDAGRLELDLGKKQPHRLSLHIHQPGFGPYWANWDASDHPQPIPTEFTARLERGWSVGGVVVDEDGKPIAGAKVRPSIEYKKRPGDTSQMRAGARTTTAEDGTWQFDSVPDSYADVTVEITHSGHSTVIAQLARDSYEVAREANPTEKTIMPSGLTVTGRVTDSAGQPIAGAKVRTKFHNDVRSATTDETGHYRLVGCKPNMARIVVSAPGKAMELQEIRVDPDMAPVDFVLQDGGKVRVKVVDENGVGIPKARIFFQSWRGRIDYFEFDHVDQYANDQGIWEWNEAPLDEFEADICRPGGMQLTYQKLKAGDEEYIFSPPPKLEISGMVTDAKTGRPIEKFRVVRGLRNKNPRIGIDWIESDVYDATDGAYRVAFDRVPLAAMVRVEANGYRVKASRDIKPDEGQVDLSFELEGEKSVEITPQPKNLDLNIIVAKHVLLLNGKQIITWPELTKKILDLPNPNKSQVHFLFTNGAHQAGRYQEVRDLFGPIRKEVQLQGHSMGSVSPRTAPRFDRIKTEQDLQVDPSQKLIGTVVDAQGKPVPKAEVVLITPVDESVSTKTYGISLVQGKVRNALDHVMTVSGTSGQFQLYPPEDLNYYVMALHPKSGFRLSTGSQLSQNQEIKLLNWATLECKLDEVEQEQQSVDLATEVPENKGLPRVSMTQYWSDRREEEADGSYIYQQIPAIYNTLIRRSFKYTQGTSHSVHGATVSLYPGEVRTIDLGPLSNAQHEQLEWIRSRTDERKKKTEERKNTWQPGKLMKALQGEWLAEWQSSSGNEPMIAHVEGDQIRLCQPNGENPMTFVFTIASGTPHQKITLKPKLSTLQRQEILAEIEFDTELTPLVLASDGFPGIIEAHDGGFRFCLPLGPGGERPMTFTVNKSQGLWVLKRPVGDKKNLPPAH